MIISLLFSGGLSNWLFHVSLPSDVHPRGTEPSQVLLRLYGQTHGDRALEALITESVIFTLLSERRLGPKLHGVFPGGRIEEYIPVSFVSIIYSLSSEFLDNFVKITFSYFWAKL